MLKCKNLFYFVSNGNRLNPNTGIYFNACLLFQSDLPSQITFSFPFPHNFWMLYFVLKKPAFYALEFVVSKVFPSIVCLNYVWQGLWLVLLFCNTNWVRIFLGIVQEWSWHGFSTPFQSSVCYCFWSQNRATTSIAWETWWRSCWVAWSKPPVVVNIICSWLIITSVTIAYLYTSGHFVEVFTLSGSRNNWQHFLYLKTTPVHHCWEQG